jgi:hypothetical protein
MVSNSSLVYCYCGLGDGPGRSANEQFLTLEYLGSKLRKRCRSGMCLEYMRRCEIILQNRDKEFKEPDYPYSVLRMV